MFFFFDFFTFFSFCKGNFFFFSRNTLYFFTALIIATSIFGHKACRAFPKRLHFYGGRIGFFFHDFLFVVVFLFLFFKLFVLLIQQVFFYVAGDYFKFFGVLFMTDSFMTTVMCTLLYHLNYFL